MPASSGAAQGRAIGNAILPNFAGTPAMLYLVDNPILRVRVLPRYADLAHWPKPPLRPILHRPAPRTAVQIAALTCAASRFRRRDKVGGSQSLSGNARRPAG
jgi:hypothetical protein